MNTSKNTHLEHLISYCTVCNPDGVRSILAANNLMTYDTPQHMEKALMELVRKEGTEGVIELLKVHPDREAISELNDIEKPQAMPDVPAKEPEFELEKKPCGCGGHAQEGSFIAKYVDGKEDCWLVGIAAMTALALIIIIFKD
ncbi:hypothetical protein [Rhodoflexus caldus]|uniref:hypothetical protein n=1 Tax=Rhodoflexus caldus TaxID=2891236 RepID=UPI00202A913D|nr:hypothetical protein [Rhodoflexus caldus]